MPSSYAFFSSPSVILDWQVIQKQTAKTFAELQATPRHLSTIDIEVVPYKVFWGRVGELLG